MARKKTEIRLLGSGTILSSGEQACSSTLIQFEGNKILVDCGAGSFLHLKKLGIQPNEIDFIFLTHFHPDHMADLILYFFFLVNSPAAKTRSLQIWGPAGLTALINNFRLIYGDWLDSQRFIINELSSPPLQFESFSVDWLKVLHNRESVGYRFHCDQKIISFSGDSSYCPELVNLCRYADIAFLECSFPDENEKAGHLTPVKVGQISREAEIKQLVITHLYPELQRLDPVLLIKKIYSGKIMVGQDFDHFTL
jgi:ribonuclease BN (tRNA processing enzyme)